MKYLIQSKQSGRKSSGGDRKMEYTSLNLLRPTMHTS